MYAYDAVRSTEEMPHFIELLNATPVPKDPGLREMRTLDYMAELEDYLNKLDFGIPWVGNDLKKMISDWIENKKHRVRIEAPQEGK